MRARVSRIALLLLTLGSVAVLPLWADAAVSLGATGSYDVGSIPTGESLLLAPSSATAAALYGDIAYSQFLAKSDRSSASVSFEGIGAYDPLSAAHGLFAGARLSGGLVGDMAVLNATLFGNLNWWSAAAAPAWALEALPDAYGPGALSPSPVALVVPTGSAGVQLSASLGGPDAAITLTPRFAALVGPTPGWSEDLSLRGDLAAHPQLVLSLSALERYEGRSDGTTSWQAGGGPGLTWYSPHGAVLDAGLSVLVQRSSLLTQLATLGAAGSAAALSVPADSFVALQSLFDLEAAVSPQLRGRLSVRPALLLRDYPHVEAGTSGGAAEWELVVPIGAEIIFSPTTPLSLHLVPSWIARFSNSDYRRYQSFGASFFAAWEF